MMPEDINRLLGNYTALVEKVDRHIRTVETACGEQIACRKGCDDCCRFLTLFPVEAFALAAAFSRLPESVRAGAILAAQTSSDACPLLTDHHCLLYEARPIICRTHGFPLYMEKEGEAFVDFCPKNFTGMGSLPKEVLLNLEQLNTLLTAVNRHFIESVDTDAPLPDRIPVSEALGLLDRTA